MQFTTAIAALVLAAVGIQAVPLEERQVNTIYARYYADGGCHGDWLEDTVFIEGENPTACVNDRLPLEYGSIEYAAHTTTRTLRVYNAPDCPETGANNYYDIKPTDTGCRAGQFKSYRFL